MRHLINRLWRSILRPASFVGKDITQIRRQPQLIIALIIAPFLVLLLFGIGYEGSAPPIHTVLVIPAESDLTTDRSVYEDNFVSPLVLDEVTTEIGPPLRRLRDQEIDLVVAFPDDASTQSLPVFRPRLGSTTTSSSRLSATGSSLLACANIGDQPNRSTRGA